MKTPGTSEDFIANWKALFNSKIKFIPSALDSINPCLPEDKEEYLQLFFSPDHAQRVRDYWIKRGEAAELTEQYELAYRCYYSAGWDLAVQDGIEEVLDRLEKAAARGGYTGLSLLARHHRLSIS